MRPPARSTAWAAASASSTAKYVLQAASVPMAAAPEAIAPTSRPSSVAIRECPGAAGGIASVSAHPSSAE